MELQETPDLGRLYIAARSEYASKSRFATSCSVMGLYAEFFKRPLDLIVAVLFLLLGLPVMILVAVAIKIDSPGPVIFSQVRVGKDGCLFRIYKFRSMVHNAEQYTGPVWANKRDERITRVGRIIRKTRLDELPQLLNVLKGDMSLVGPRPERPIFVEKFSRDIPQFPLRLAVRPGLTGLAQVSGGYEHTPRQKLRYDLLYIKRLSFYLDLLIILKTVRVVFSGSGAR